MAINEYAFFYNSDNGDRKYDADSFSDWLKKFFTNGVFTGDLQVTAGEGMTVVLSGGYANINGKVRLFNNDQNFTISAANSQYPRIDTIIIERNDVERNIIAKYVMGQYSGDSPAPTPPERENEVYQLVLAQIYISPGITEITQAAITDTRSDTSICGIVTGTVKEMDFSQFSAQFDSYYQQFKDGNQEDFNDFYELMKKQLEKVEFENEEEFNIWFEHIKDQLSEDAAGKLQNEIDTLASNVGVQDITQEDFDALPESTKNDGTTYYIDDPDENADYPAAWNMEYDNTKSGVNENNIQDIIDKLIMISGTYRRSINLGDSYTDELKEDIQSGKFIKAVVGGYLTINGHIYDFVHPDYWLHTGDAECTKHHMVVVPRTALAIGPMNSTNTTTGAYAGSLMRGSSGALKEAAAIIKADFGAENILTHREYFANATKQASDPTYESAGAWYDSDIDLMNERMVYGADVFHNVEVNGAIPPNYTIDKSQLKLFAERPDLITTRVGWWLRDVVSGVTFAHVSDGGNANATYASSAFGVRPAFAIC